MGPTMNKKEEITNSYKEKEQLVEQHAEEKRKKRKLKKLAQTLGVKDIRNLHIDKYTTELKALVGQL